MPTAAPDGGSTAVGAGAGLGAESSLNDEISAMLGNDFGDSDYGESPAGGDGSAGAPPASDATAAPENAAGGTSGTDPGTPGAEHAGATPAVAASAPPDTAGTPGTPQDDPLAGSAPLTYVVNGQTRTYEGMTLLRDGGAFVLPDQVARLQQRLSERDHLFEKDQQSYRDRQGLDNRLKAYDGLTEWIVGKNNDGSNRVITGADALEARTVLTARSMAAVQTLGRLFDDANVPAQLVEVRQDPQTGQAYLAWNQAAIASLKDRVELASVKAESAARGAFAQRRAPFNAAGGPPQPAAPAEAPIQALTPEVAKGMVEEWLQREGISGLTPDDKAFLAQQAPFYERNTTPTERAQWGPRILDAAFRGVIQDRAARRAEAARVATVSSSANDQNARRLAAAAISQRRGPMPNGRAPAPTDNRAKNQEEAWAALERATAAAM
jgi:hypothetical protein